MTYFLDTNIVSYHLKGNSKIESKIRNLLFSGANIKISRVVFYEIKRGLLSQNATTKLQKFLLLTNVFGIVEMQDSTFDIAAKIYADLKQKGILIEDDDIFIGATALENDAILVTNNAKHLGRIDGLKLEIWEE